MKYFVFLIILGISVVSIGCNSIDNQTSKVEAISQEEFSAGDRLYVYTTKADCCSLKIAINSPPQIDSSLGFDFSSKELELKLSHDFLNWTFQLPEIF